ncbi:MAG: DUF2946 family protein [Gammaproteobacteria bacterium]|nr:DUF2946 family protein [Gammaproteobacteria bacterium]
MDQAVLKAMARWPNVPAVYGWLSLDRRGRWLIKGETIANETLRHFISRNYLADGDGHHAFQNGPQKVYVELAYTPWVVQVDPAGALILHTGEPVAALSGAWVDETGSVLLQTDKGIALLDDRDLERLADRWCAGDGSPLDDEGREARLEQLVEGEPADLAMPWQGQLIPIATIRSACAAAQFGFKPMPRPPAP